MLRTMSFLIRDTPIPLQRPRMSGSHCWDSQKQQKLVIGIQLTTQFHDSALFEGPLLVELNFHFPFPKRMTAKQRIDNNGMPYIGKIDIDNCIKMYLDCAIGILYKDDATVTEIISKKVYGKPHTQMIITELT